jgi:hypothetical protein
MSPPTEGLGDASRRRLAGAQTTIFAERAFGKA